MPPLSHPRPQAWFSFSLPVENHKKSKIVTFSLLTVKRKGNIAISKFFKSSKVSSSFVTSFRISIICESLGKGKILLVKWEVFPPCRQRNWTTVQSSSCLSVLPSFLNSKITLQIYVSCLDMTFSRIKHKQTRMKTTLDNRRHVSRIWSVELEQIAGHCPQPHLPGDKDRTEWRPGSTVI